MLEEMTQSECESGVSGRSGGSKEESIKKSVCGGSTERAERVEQAEKGRGKGERRQGREYRESGIREGMDGKEAAEGRREQWRGGERRWRRGRRQCGESEGGLERAGERRERRVQ